MSKIFNNVGSLSPERSVFDLSYEKKFTCDMGQIIPIMCDEVVPSDFFDIGTRLVARMQPLVAPILHTIEVKFHFYFVNYRILWDNSKTDSWEAFITGGEDGSLAPSIPEWIPTKNGKGTLWDFLINAVGVNPVGAYPVDFPRRAYNKIYNEYYRNQTLQAEVSLDNEDILQANWAKDYFTAALPWQQRGIAPALPISGTGFAEWSAAIPITGSINVAFRTDGDNNDGAQLRESTSFPGRVTEFTANVLNSSLTTKTFTGTSIPVETLNNNLVDLSNATTFDVSDLRLVFQIQKWLERNARAGSRYTELLKAHFNWSSRDERLQRPEYIGGMKTPIIVSEVLQTSSTDATTPQGNMAGHGISVAQARSAKFKVPEYGLIMGLMIIRPKADYQQGINRQWVRKTKYDYYWREFANLSEQAVYNYEICAKDSAAHNNGIWGYIPRYDEMRIKHNMVCGDMRDTYDYWHIGRQFDPAAPPELNSDFVTCNPRKDIFAVPSEPGFICTVGNIIKAVRPMPITGEPGLIDHN